MESEIKLVRREEKLLVYEVESPDLVSNAFVDSLDWPSSIPTLVINFGKILPRAFDILEKNLSGKYLSRLIYCADKTDLAVPEKRLPCPQIRRYEFSGLEELKRLYLDTETEYFGKPWAGKLGFPWDRYLEGKYYEIIKANAEHHLPEARVLCLEKGGVPVALFPLNKANYFDGSDIDWILWVWIDPALSREERYEIKRQFVQWLGETAASRIVTGVNTFNVPSNRFFEGIGFKAECIQITRPS